jgi:DtxR family Mn-dependent transcriptional regulator
LYDHSSHHIAEEFARSQIREQLLASLTIENYVKTIYLICRGGHQTASTGEVAQNLGVSPGSVTSMLKTLKDAGLAEYKPYEGVQLTNSGRSLALRILRRHRLIEVFLIETLHFNWDEVHEEAENLEHAVSDLLIDRIDEFLNFPASDPYGDPIPGTDGTLPAIAQNLISLSDLEQGAAFRLKRVSDQSIEFLRFLSETNLILGTRGRVVANCLSSGVVTIDHDGRETTIALPIAQKLKVETIVEVA